MSGSARPGIESMPWKEPQKAVRAAGPAPDTEAGEMDLEVYRPRI